VQLAQRLGDLADRAAKHGDRLGALQRELDAARSEDRQALEGQRRDLDERLGAFVNGYDELVRAEIGLSGGSRGSGVIG